MSVIISNLKYLGKKGIYHLVNEHGRHIATFKDGKLTWGSVIYLINLK